MPRVEFLESAAGRAKTIESEEGGAVVDLCDEYFAPVPFSCRSASCATCEIEVLEGMEFLEPPNAEEGELLALLKSPGHHRLGCQAVLKSGGGLVRIRSVN